MTDGNTDKPGKAKMPPPTELSGDNNTPREHGGPKGPEPTRYGDWERKGRCIDF